MRLLHSWRLPLIKTGLLLLIIVPAGLVRAQPWAPEGYLMSAMTYDSLGFQIRVDDESSRGRSTFDRVLQSECSDILQRNGIRCVPRDDAASKSRYPVIVIDVTVTPLDGTRGSANELYYGSISFQREVTLFIAERPRKTLGSMWSMTFGGQARSRLAIVSDIEARLMDFLEDYLKLNSAKWIWK